MAEALYPVEPPPSYESQFLQHQAYLKDSSPLPSAPPLHPLSRMNRPRPRSRSDPHTSSLAKLASMPTKQKELAASSRTKNSSTGQEKENMSPRPRRVPKRLPPPPPNVPPSPKSGSRQRSHLCTTGLTAISNSFSQPTGESFPGLPPNTRAEMVESVSRESNVSASMYNITEHSDTEDYRPLSAMLSSSYHPSAPHTYEYIDDFYQRPQNSLDSSLREGNDERVVYAVPVRRRMAAQFNRQASAPACVPLRLQGGAQGSLTDSLGGVSYFPQTSLPEESIIEASGNLYHHHHPVARPRPPASSSPPVHCFVDPHSTVQMPLQQAHRQIHIIPESAAPMAAPQTSEGVQPSQQNAIISHFSQVPAGSNVQYPMASIQQLQPLRPVSNIILSQSASVNPSGISQQSEEFKPMPKPRSQSSIQPANVLLNNSSNQQGLPFNAQQQQIQQQPNELQNQQQPQQQFQVPHQNLSIANSYNNNNPSVVASPQQQTLVVSQQPPNQQQQQQHVLPASNQVLAAVPGVSQLHTYSYTQQSAMVTIPEIMNQQQGLQGLPVSSAANSQPPVMLGMPHSLSTPLIAGIGSGIPNSMTVPTQLNVQVLQPTSNSLQQESDSQQNVRAQANTVAETQNKLETASIHVSDSNNENKDSSNTSTEPTRSVVEPPNSAALRDDTPVSSPQRGPRRPVPKPRNFKRALSALDADQGAMSGGEGEERGRSQSDVGIERITPGDPNNEAPAKPPRRFARKPAPPPPIPAGTPSASALEEGLAEDQEGAHDIEEEISPPVGNSSPPSAEVEQPESSQPTPKTPTGYKIKDIFSNGNVLILLPLSDPLRLPVKTSGSSVRGKGAFKNDCKFEVVYLSSAMGHEQTVLVVMLKSFSRINRYLTVNAKGKLKMSKGATEKAKFIVRHVSERPLLRYGVVTLESAIHPEWFISLSARGKPRSCATPRTAVRMDESRFAVRVDRIFNPYSSCLLCHDKPSIMNQVRDRQIIQLQCAATDKYLCLTMKGKLRDTGNNGDLSTHFMFFDRGMGVGSLRSSKNSKYWLRVKEGRVQGNGKPDLASDFRLLECPDGSVMFESIITPGIFLHPPCDSTQTETPSKNFRIKLVSK